MNQLKFFNYAYYTQSGYLGLSASIKGIPIASIYYFNLALENGRLIWTAPVGSNWNTGETLSFFWQTSQPPIGPGGVYTASNDTQVGSAMGPFPVPIPTVPESNSYWSLIGLAVAIFATKRRASQVGSLPIFKKK